MKEMVYDDASPPQAVRATVRAAYDRLAMNKGGMANWAKNLAKKGTW